MHEAMPAPRPRRRKSAARALTVRPPQKTPELLFHETMLAMRPKLPAISKDEKMLIRGHNIELASYPAIRRATDAILDEFGMYIIHQGVVRDGGLYVVRSWLYHRDGFYVMSECAPPTKPIPGSATSEAQALGGALTTGRRVNTLALLNLRTESPEDLDRELEAVRVKRITGRQERELKAAINKHNVPWPKFKHHFLEKYGLELLRDLPAGDFQLAMKTVTNYVEPATQPEEQTNAEQDPVA